MANNQRFSITFDASLNVSQIKGALGDIQKGLNSLHLPQNATKSLQGTFSKLSEEIQKFEASAGKEIGSKADFSKLEKSASKIGDLFNTLKRQVSELTGLKGKALEKLFPDNVSKNISQASNALKNYQTAFRDAQKDVNKASEAVDKFNKAIEREKGKTAVSPEKFKEVEQESKAAQLQVDELTNKLQELQQKQANLQNTLTQPNKSSVYRSLGTEISKVSKELDDAKKKAAELAAQKANTTTFDKQAKKIAELTANLTDAQAKLIQFKQIFDQLKNPQGGDISKLIEEVGRLTGLDMSKFTADAKGVGQAIETYIVQEAEKMSQGLNKVGSSVDGAGTHIQNLGKQMQDVGREIANTDAKMREVDALKSRIQYFFGLNNTIELVKRTIRSAFQTVKELDAAMTETAVVTDFSVADMWAQLPDYTKRANDLGVTTKAAYEAATLYYQQGLKTNEVTAMSNETLKMARIAGLDAAVATDRMTNAIRGFNMEINEVNAQRIDDVYSKLAAISASNVDEISTAMTKVASLANSANMEFETTSAFLAQIIETTRESAETAGTALKTVVARFSEVKKLVSEDQLKGQDEEGQLIDVNKVSAALRTAGVDLNKYFLGEVGLDDIFMELASKWDSLTTLQQRYIATQAAGSRQQSRFIALMSDYGRMQELVGEAYSSNGAAAEQFAKTQESLESKLARLKNAWNEFAMGIANSDLIKAGVDFLTLLLNGVNKLTDGFGLLTGSVGGFVSSILKLGLLISGLSLGKSLIGGSIGGLGALFNGTEGGFSAGFGKATGAKKGNFTKTVFSNLSTGAQGFGKGLFNFGKSATESISNFGFKLGTSKNIFGKIAGGIGAKGANLATALGLGGDAAATVGGFAATLGTIAPIAIGAALAVKKLYDLSPTGQVKIAEKYAATISKVANEAKKTETSLKDAQTKYKEYSQAIFDSSNVQDHSKAIQDRNEYLTSLLEQDASFAEYLQSEIQNGELVLSINEEAFANAIAKAEEAVQESKVSDLLAQANLSAQKADLAATMAAASRDISYNENGDIISSKDTATSLRYKSQQQASTFQAQSFAQQAALEMLGDANLGDELTKTLANSYATAFDADKYQKDASGRNWFARTLDHAGIKREYEAVYGLGSSKDLTYKEMDQAVQASKAAEGEQAKIDELIDYLKKDDTGKYEDVLKAYSGDFSNFSSLISQGELNLDLDSEALNNVADSLGLTIDQLTTQIQNYAQTERERQLQTRDTGYYSLAKGGASKLDIARYLTLDNFEDMELISGLAQKFESSGVGGEIAHSILDQIESGTFEGSDLQKWLENLNFDSPIAGAKALHDALQLDDGDPIKQLAMTINASEEAMSQFSASAQLNYLMTSEGAEQLNDSIEDFIEKNGEINSGNIKELAASNADLNSLLETGAFTAKALAVALNEIQSGEIQFYDLTDSIITALNAMDDLDGIVASTIEDLNNFDPGYDENDIIGFINKAYENATENFNKGAYGNNQMANYMREIFGTFTPEEGQDYSESYKAWLQGNISWLEANKENMYSAWSDVAAAAEQGAQLAGASIKNTGSEIILETNGATTQELIQALQENFNYTETQARMLIADFKNYSADFAHELAQNDLPSAIEAWVGDKLKTGQVINTTEKELDTLATVLNVGRDEVEKEISKTLNIKRKGKINIIDTDAMLKDVEKLKNVMSSMGHTVGAEGIFNFEALRTGLSELGLADKFNKELNAIVGDATTFQANINGKLVEITRKAGQDSATAYAEALEAESQKQFGANFFAGIIETAAANNINIDPVNIPIDIDTKELQSELSVTISQLNTLENRKPNVKVGVDTSLNTTISKLQQILDLLNQVNNTETSPTVSTVHKPNANKNNPPIAASGGYVRSAASGTRSILPGIALTGEEDPEIVWNKEQGYAYITGDKGPEFQNLRPGDRVFNAQETKKILKRSKQSGVFPSFASGKYPSYASAYGAATKSGAGVGSSSKTSTKTSSNSEKSSEEWKNELDWLYNLMEDIAESERTQEKLATQHERYLKDSSKTGKDLYNITKQQMKNLNQQYAYQTQALRGREKEMQEQINQSRYTNYVRWNNKDRTIEIDWDKIEKIQDKDTYDKVSELVSKAEDIQSKIDTAEDAIEDIKDQMKELQERYVQEYIDFQQRVLEAVVNKYQENIDNLNELNDTINESNTNILNSIRDEIDLQRQIRDNTDTENEISDMEARLAYLRRDTMGANQNEILQLEKQLEDTRESYSDTLIDQSIDRLADANDKAAEQREHQIQILTAQLEYWQKNGDLWPEVAKLMKEGISSKGYILFGSDLMSVLKNAEGFQGMSSEQQKQWIEQLEEDISPVNAYSLSQKHPVWDNTTDYMAIMQSLLQQRGSQALLEPAYQDAAAARMEKRISQGATREQAKKEQQALEDKYLKKKTRYATGGLNTSPGLAWLDGTSKEPEYVLNARQTEAFLRLSEVLPSIFSNGVNYSNTIGGNVYLELTMNVGEIGSDYDVDRLVERVKSDIYETSAYRNVNIVNRSR